MRYDLKEPLGGGVEAVACRIRFGAGELTLDGAAPEGLLASGDLEYEHGDEPPRHRVRAGRTETILEIDAGRRHHIPHTGGLDWELHLSPKPVYNIVRLDLGACRCRLDLSQLKMREFELNTGASKSVVTLGDWGLHTRAAIKAGAAELRLRIPRSVGVLVDTSGVFASSNLGNSNFVLGRRTWTSDGYEGKKAQLELELRAGATSFNVDWID